MLMPFNFKNIKHLFKDEIVVKKIKCRDKNYVYKHFIHSDFHLG